MKLVNGKMGKWVDELMGEWKMMNFELMCK